jgi:hypothetical protein
MSSKQQGEEHTGSCLYEQQQQLRANGKHELVLGAQCGGPECCWSCTAFALSLGTSRQDLAFVALCQPSECCPRAAVEEDPINIKAFPDRLP